MDRMTAEWQEAADFSIGQEHRRTASWTSLRALKARAEVWRGEPGRASGR